MTRRVITAREQHEMLLPWREAVNLNQDWIRRKRDEDWAQRSLTPAQQRQQHAEGINDSETKLEWDSRPKEGDEDYESGPEHLPQDTLPGMDGIRGESTRLWRGQPIDTSDPAFRKVWQMTYGQGQPVDDPGLFPDADLRYQDRGGEFDHPGLSDAILDGFEAKGGVGEHHSTSFDVADEYGRGNAAGSDPRGKGPHLPVLLDSDWNGAEENLSRGGSGNVHQEKEIMLNRRKAPLHVVDLRVPGNADEAENFGSWDDDEGWNSILDKPRNVTAASQYLLPGMPSRKPGTKPTPEPEDEGDWWRDSWRMNTPEPEPDDDYEPSDDDDDDWQHESWMHVSPHKLEPGTELRPGGGASPYNGKTLAPGHRHNVWIDRPHAMKGWTDEMKQHSPDAKFYYYDVEPLDKPEPNAWGPELGYAVPGARIVQRRDDFDPGFPEEY